MERYRETLNDGFLTYGHKKTIRTADKTVIGSEFLPEGKLAYKEMSARDSDYQLADIKSAKLDMKVKTLYPPSFRKINKNKLKIILNNTEYDVINVDSDATKSYLFFYLQEVGVSNERKD